MSRYFVTSEPSHQYPFTFQDLRVRPPKKRSGLLLVTIASISALCGGAAAYALMTSADDPAPVQVASLDRFALVDTAIAAKSITAEPGAKAPEPVTLKPETVEPINIAAVEDRKVEISVAETPDDGLVPLGKNNPRWSGEPVAADDVLDRQSDGKTVGEALRRVAIAETEDDVVALEEQMNPELLAMVSPDISNDPAGAAIADEPVKPVHVSAPVFATGDLAPARATKWVNMRAEAKKGAAKMMVVPENAEIMSDPTCQYWCRVVYDGRLGYVFRTYIRFPGETSVAAKAAEPAETVTAQRSEGGIIKKLIRGGRIDP